MSLNMNNLDIQQMLLAAMGQVTNNNTTTAMNNSSMNAMPSRNDLDLILSRVAAAQQGSNTKTQQADVPASITVPSSVVVHEEAHHKRSDTSDLAACESLLSLSCQKTSASASSPTKNAPVGMSAPEDNSNVNNELLHQALNLPAFQAANNTDPSMLWLRLLQEQAQSQREEEEAQQQQQRQQEASLQQLMALLAQQEKEKKEQEEKKRKEQEQQELLLALSRLVQPQQQQQQQQAAPNGVGDLSPALLAELVRHLQNGQQQQQQQQQVQVGTLMQLLQNALPAGNQQQQEQQQVPSGSQSSLSNSNCSISNSAASSKLSANRITPQARSAASSVVSPQPIKSHALSSALSSCPTTDTSSSASSESMPPPRCPQRRRRRGRVGTFPQKLLQVLEDLEENGKGHIASFVGHHGKAFCIHEPEVFAAQVMPHYFKMGSYASFQRQLNLYEFQRIGEGPLRGAYHHKSFAREEPHLSVTMKRNKNKGFARPLH